MSTVDVIVEIPLGESTKYEFDHETGLMRGDRRMTTPMTYPGNYGFIPNTISGDDDPIDVIIPVSYKLLQSTIHRCRVIGALITQDEACVDEQGQVVKGKHDEKIIAIPVYDKGLNHWQNYSDLPTEVRGAIRYFFEHYKDNEPNKWVKIIEEVDGAAALKIIAEYASHTKEA